MKYTDEVIKAIGEHAGMHHCSGKYTQQEWDTKIAKTPVAVLINAGLVHRHAVTDRLNWTKEAETAYKGISAAVSMNWNRLGINNQ